MYFEIKKGLINALKSVSDIPVIFERNEDTESTDQYFYTVIKPVSKVSESINLQSETYIIDILFSDRACAVKDFMILAGKLDEVFYEGLKCDTFHAFIKERSANIVDDELHYTFSVNITYEVRKERAALFMADLIIS